jgi:anti-sigma regulatory factor (Ser/Thr protein kinase)
MTRYLSTPPHAATSATAWKYSHSYPALADQVGKARASLTQALAGCPLADDVVLICSELASNAVLHSASSKPGGRFTIRVEAHEGDYLWIEVEDEGDPWAEPRDAQECGWGLQIVAALATSWGIEGDLLNRVAWVRLDWPTT